MFNIQKYLEKFSKNIQDKEYSIEQVLFVIKKHTGITIFSKNIEIKNCIIYIKSTPAVLNKVFIYKTKILEEISSQIKNINIIDIR